MGKPLAPRDAVPVDAGSAEEVLTLLRAQGGRATPSKRVLLEVLFEAAEPRTAEQLADAVWARVPDVHLSTIYRNLEDLQRLGVLAHSHIGHGPTAYQLSSHAHAHFVCDECGAVVEAPDDVFGSLVRAAKDRLGFTLDAHHVAIPGRCADCS